MESGARQLLCAVEQQTILSRLSQSRRQLVEVAAMLLVMLPPHASMSCAGSVGEESRAHLHGSVSSSTCRSMHLRCNNYNINQPSRVMYYTHWFIVCCATSW